MAKKQKKIFEEPFYENVISTVLQSPAKDLKKLVKDDKAKETLYNELKADPQVGGWLASGQVGAIDEFAQALSLIEKGELTALEMANAANNLINMTGNTTGTAGMYDTLEGRIKAGRMTYGAAHDLAQKTSNDYVSSILRAHEASYRHRVRRNQ